MAKLHNRTRESQKVRARWDYPVELARGSSHIASTLTDGTRRSAIDEVLDEFAACHGADKLEIFRELLAESLAKRGQGDAARAVLDGGAGPARGCAAAGCEAGRAA